MFRLQADLDLLLHRAPGEVGDSAGQRQRVHVAQNPQVVLFSHDVQRAAEFYARFGFVEVFRVPTEGPAIHIDVELDGVRLGLASVDSTRDDHGLDPVGEGQRAVVVVWTDDVAATYRALTDDRVAGLRSPHVWLDRLLIAWVADPDGHPVQLVQPFDG